MNIDEQRMTLQDALNDPTTEGALVDQGHSQVQLLSDAEINRQITTAKRYPRSVSTFRKRTLELVSLSESVATECIYALPRAGKTIEGPSIRFAEILQSTWGNMRTGARPVSEDGAFVYVQAAFHDLESNAAMTLEIKRRITDRQGKRYNEDMIGVTANAACSIALRNVILRGIPKALWHDAYVAARKVVAGDFKTLPNRREDALKAFVIYGVTSEQIYAALGVKGKDDIGIDNMITLAGFLNALKDGSGKPEDFFEAAVDPKRPTRENVAGDDLPTSRKPRKPKMTKAPDLAKGEDQKIEESLEISGGEPSPDKAGRQARGEFVNNTGVKLQGDDTRHYEQQPSEALTSFLAELEQCGSIQTLDAIKGRAKPALSKEEFATFMNAFLTTQRRF